MKDCEKGPPWTFTDDGVTYRVQLYHTASGTLAGQLGRVAFAFSFHAPDHGIEPVDPWWTFEASREGKTLARGTCAQMSQCLGHVKDLVVEDHRALSTCPGLRPSRIEWAPRIVGRKDGP